MSGNFQTKATKPNDFVVTIVVRGNGRLPDSRRFITRRESKRTLIASGGTRGLLLNIPHAKSNRVLKIYHKVCQSLDDFCNDNMLPYKFKHTQYSMQKSELCF